MRSTDGSILPALDEYAFAPVLFLDQQISFVAFGCAEISDGRPTAQVFHDAEALVIARAKQAHLMPQQHKTACQLQVAQEIARWKRKEDRASGGIDYARCGAWIPSAPQPPGAPLSGQRLSVPREARMYCREPWQQPQGSKGISRQATESADRGWPPVRAPSCSSRSGASRSCGSTQADSPHSGRSQPGAVERMEGPAGPAA